MYGNNAKQLQFENFALPFDGKLRSDDRWARMAKFIPREEIEPFYAKSLSGTRMGSPALSAGVAIGALIIKERLGTSDEETVERIRENPYLRYFLGFKEFRDEAPFDPSMFVQFRKRIGTGAICGLNEKAVSNALYESKKHSKRKSSNHGDDYPGPPVPGDKGKLIVDATCTPADITFPTDLKLTFSTFFCIFEEFIDIFIGIIRYKWIFYDRVFTIVIFRKNAMARVE